LISDVWASNYFLRARTASAFRQAGLPDKAQEIVAKIESDSLTEYVGPGNLAIAYIAIADYDRAYQILSDAAADGSIPLDWAATNEIRENVWNDPILEEPRFKELRSRIGVWK